jgi:hypothetical protein
LCAGKAFTKNENRKIRNSRGGNAGNYVAKEGSRKTKRPAKSVESKFAGGHKEPDNLGQRTGA